MHLSAPKEALSIVRIHHRRVTHAERFIAQPKSGAGGEWKFEIGADYTNSRYALQYYFQLSAQDGTSWFYPGLAPDLANLPYYVFRSAGSRA